MFLGAFWLSLSSFLDTKITRSSSFHLQIDGMINFINMMIMHILCMHNSKHPQTWDEILPYIQHKYNISIHFSTSHNPFQVGMRFQALCPIDVAIPFATTQIEYAHAQFEDDKSTKFIKWLQHY